MFQIQFIIDNSLSCWAAIQVCRWGWGTIPPIIVPLKASLQEMPISMPVLISCQGEHLIHPRYPSHILHTLSGLWETMLWSQQMEVELNTQSCIKYWINCASGNGAVELFVTIGKRKSFSVSLLQSNPDTLENCSLKPFSKANLMGYWLMCQ